MSEEKTATITIQIEPGKKQRMEEFFEELGLSLPYGVSIFFEQCISFFYSGRSFARRIGEGLPIQSVA